MIGLDDLVCSLEQSKILNGLGLEQDTIFEHVIFHDSPNHEVELVGTYDVNSHLVKFAIPTYSVAELGQLLPARIHLDHDYFINLFLGKRGWHVEYKTNKGEVIINAEGEIDHRVNYLFQTWRCDYNMASAMAQYLILLMEQRVLLPHEINGKLKR